MAKYRFEEFAINCTEKKIPAKEDYATYIGLEHMDTKNIHIARWGSDVPIIGEKLVMHKGDILFGKRNTYLRRAAIAPHDGIFSAHGMILRPKEDIVDYDFFALFIASDYFFDKAIQISVGSLSPTVNWKDLKDLEFDLPDMKTQKEIAKILWSINDTLDSYKEQLRLCDELVKAQFVEMFGDLNKEFTIGEVVCSDISSAKRVFTDKDTIKYIDISSIDNNKNEIVSYTEFLLEKAPSRAQQCVREKDILVSTVRPNLKNVAINKFNFQNMVVSSGFCVLRCEKCLPEYIFAIVKSDAFTNAMCALTTGANYPAVRDKDVKNYRISLPSIEKQQEFSNFVNHLDKSKVALKDSIESLNKIYTNIINTNLG